MTDITLAKTDQTGTNEWVDVQDNDDRLKDGLNLAVDSGIATASGLSIAAGTTRRDYATVSTEETTTSTSWANLSTTGPSVTITVPSTGLVLVGIEVAMKNSAGSDNYVGVYESTDFAISGTPEESEVIGSGSGSAGPGLGGFSVASSYTSLPYSAVVMVPSTAGSRTYTLKYAVSTGTGTFKTRKIWAVALGGF